jgi:hypothetical protein
VLFELGAVVKELFSTSLVKVTEDEPITTCKFVVAAASVNFAPPDAPAGFMKAGWFDVVLVLPDTTRKAGAET